MMEARLAIAVKPSQQFAQELKQRIVNGGRVFSGNGLLHVPFHTARTRHSQTSHSHNCPQHTWPYFIFSKMCIFTYKTRPVLAAPQFKRCSFAVFSWESVRGMAGHSKWANIRHIKAAKDGEKARLITEFTRRLRAFIKETGQTDPKTSSQLAKLLSEAKGKNIPAATVDRALTQMVALKNSAPMLFEAKGPGGSVMLIEAVTTRVSHTRSELQSLVRKGGFSMFESSSLARMVFDEKGVVTVNAGEDEPDLDKYVEMAIEAGAEDVHLEEDEEVGNVLQFICGPKEVYNVKRELEARQLPVRSAEVVFITKSNVPMDPAGLELLAKVMDKLDEHPAVIRVYSNIIEGP